MPKHGLAVTFILEEMVALPLTLQEMDLEIITIGKMWKYSEKVKIFTSQKPTTKVLTIISALPPPTCDPVGSHRLLSEEHYPPCYCKIPRKLWEILTSQKAKLF